MCRPTTATYSTEEESKEVWSGERGCVACNVKTRIGNFCFYEYIVETVMRHICLISCLYHEKRYTTKLTKSSSALLFSMSVHVCRDMCIRVYVSSCVELPRQGAGKRSKVRWHLSVVEMGSRQV